MRRLLTRKTVLLTVLLFLYVTVASIYATATATPVIPITLNQRITLDLGTAEHRLTFQTTSNNIYSFQSFGGEFVQAKLYQGKDPKPIAQGTGFEFNARLSADRPYTLVITGTGTTDIEIMRDALGRSFKRPLELRDLNEGYHKVIARAHDVHWYRFIPKTTGLYMITTRSNLNTLGVLLDQSGQEIVASDDATLSYDGNFALQTQLIENETYYLRVSAKGDQTGRYTIKFAQAKSGAILPTGIRLDKTTIGMKQGETAQLTATISPGNALNNLMWVSTNTKVAQVDEKGTITATGSGTADIVALAFGNVNARCTVEVDAIAVTAVRFKSPQISLPVGEQQPLGYILEPEYASNPTVRFESSDERTATVDESGNLLAHREGTVQIKVISVDGNLTDTMIIVIVPEPMKYRALVMGEQRYVDGRIRIGSVNTTQGMADVLRGQDFDGYGGYEVTMKMDSSAPEAIAYIREVFESATTKDVSLFNINCHGKYENGTPYLEFHDGSKLSAQALEQELRKIPGTVVVIIDCCNSGSFISRSQSREFSERVLGAFGAERAGAFSMSKYRVLCSSGPIQNSYRISPEGIENEATMATVFARSLCEAGGWNIVKDRTMTMKADVDKNRKVTLEEAYQYAFKRVKYYLREAADQEQDVQIYPRGSQFVLFCK